MTTKLTKTILRNAAAYIEPPVEDGVLPYRAEYMCGAISEAALEAHWPADHLADAVEDEFGATLDAHGVTHGGHLSYYDGEARLVQLPYGRFATFESQAHRVTFLLLLAESL